MKYSDAITFFETYNFIILIIGVAILAAIILPHALSKFPISMPIILMTFGYFIFIPLRSETPNYKWHGDYIEHITELAVLIAIMGAGLKIKRIPSFKNWMVTWRLLGITMILTIILTTFIGWWFAAFVPATALLLGAVIAPTDPVLASEVEVEGPGEETGEKSELKFALTSEAGLNDGLAFPFTHMALAVAVYGLNPSNWIESWLVINVFYELAVGILIGFGLGSILARYILNLPATSELAESIIGVGSLAATLIIYGTTELFGGYGFIAVFVGAVTIRQLEPDHNYQISLHAFIEKSQLAVTALVLLGLGASISGGILQNLDLTLIIIALVLVLLIRPLCGIIGLIGFNKIKWKERFAISFLGIRGIGSIYYLAYALNHQDFEGSNRLWSLVILVIVISIFIHGITVTPILNYLKKNS